MSTFPDGVFQYGGMPTMGGGVPITTGTYYWVDPTNGSDAFDGKSLKSAFATVAAAYAACTTNKNDVILLDAYAGHALSEKLTVSKNRVHFVGLDGGGRYYGQRARITRAANTTDDANIEVTGVGCTFRNLKFDNASNTGAGSYSVKDGGEYTLFENCEFYKSDDLDQADSAELLCNGDSSLYRHCTFGSLATRRAATDLPNVMFDAGVITGKVARDVMFQDCLFWVNPYDTGSVFLLADAANDAERMILFRDCVFIANDINAVTPNNIVESILTDGQMLFIGCHSVNVASWASSANNLNVFLPVYCAQEEGASDATNFQGLMVLAT